MLTAYVVLDGFDFGAGALHWFVARSDGERREVLAAIGPFWDGNEVWLLASGGTIFCIFPQLYASSFSGFYLPLMMVLWLLVGRALGIEFRHQIAHPMWTDAWDWAFTLSSTLLALFFGVALGNVVRGVPLDADGSFFEPLWTDFSDKGATGILSKYTLTTGGLAVAALAHHGALWVALRTRGDIQERARRFAARTFFGLAFVTVLATIGTSVVQPHVGRRFTEQPWGYGLPALALAGLVASWRFRRLKQDAKAFAGSCTFIAGMLAAVAFSVYPYVLPSSQDPVRGLTAEGTAASPHGLTVALAWWIPGMLLAAGYSIFVHRLFGGKVEEEPPAGAGPTGGS
jgi:cytochrome d ubiquinol oxidase subunit II